MNYSFDDDEDEDDKEFSVPHLLEDKRSQAKSSRLPLSPSSPSSSLSSKRKVESGFDADLKTLDDLLRELRVLRRNDLPSSKEEGTSPNPDSENSRKCRALVREQYSNSVRGKAQVPSSSSSMQLAKQTKQSCFEMFDEVERSEGFTSDYGYKERRALEVKLSLAASQLENTKFKYQ